MDRNRLKSVYDGSQILDPVDVLSLTYRLRRRFQGGSTATCSFPNLTFYAVQFLIRKSEKNANLKSKAGATSVPPTPPPSL